MAAKKSKKPSKPMGRPTNYSKEVAAKICAELAMGSSLRTICKSPDMPALATIYLWFNKYPDFIEQYERAKHDGADAMAEELLEIADDGTNDWMEKIGRDGEKTGEYILNGEHVQRSRLRVDARKWYLSKIKPKRYGDKVDLTSAGEKLETITRVEIVAGGNSASRATS